MFYNVDGIFHTGKEMKEDLIEIQNPPYSVGDKVKFENEIFYIISISYEYRMVPYRGWSVDLATEEDIIKEYGGFGPVRVEDLYDADA